MQERVIRALKKYLELIKKQNIAIVTHLGPILAVAEYMNYNISSVNNLDGLVITYDDKKYKLTTHNKLITNSKFAPQ